MPRRARLRIADIPLHIVQRGNNHSACFYTNADYALYLGHLTELATKFECAIHAYALMTNHVHLLLTPARKEGPSLLMKNLGQRYVQYINKRYRRSGTLWEGRFRSSIVQEERYLLRCHRYIEMNPVRARMVRDPGDYRWSSYLANANGKPSRLLTPHASFLGLGKRQDERRHAYRALFQAKLDPSEIDEIRSAVNGGFALGDVEFKTRIAAVLGQRVSRCVSGRAHNNEPSQVEAARLSVSLF